MMLKKQLFNGSNTLNVVSYARGMYTLLITNDKGERIAQQKIMIQ